MARAYSLDLRERVVGAIVAGQSCRAVAATFKVSVASVVKWSQRFAAFEPVGRQAGAGDRGPKGSSEARTAAEKRYHIRRHRSPGISIVKGCRLMGIARSTYFDQPSVSVDDTALVEMVAAISDGFEAHGYRRMQAALRQRGRVRKSQEDSGPDARA